MNEWVEEKRGVKFLCWETLKDGVDKDDAFVVKDGESFEADILKLDKVDDIEGIRYKYRLHIEGQDKDVLMWSNAAIARQQENLLLVEGEHIKVSFDGFYSTKYKGKKGRNIRIAVMRNGKKGKK